MPYPSHTEQTAALIAERELTKKLKDENKKLTEIWEGFLDKEGDENLKIDELQAENAKLRNAIEKAVSHMDEEPAKEWLEQAMKAARQKEVAECKRNTN